MEKSAKRQALGSHHLFNISVLSAICGFIPRSHSPTRGGVKTETLKS
jgi:hypothetical protein